METFKKLLKQRHDIKIDVLINVRKNYEYMYAIIRSEQDDLSKTQPEYFFTKGDVQDYIDKHLKNIHTDNEVILIKTVDTDNYSDGELIDIIMNQ
jgi:hypothetical protein